MFAYYRCLILKNLNNCISYLHQPVTQALRLKPSLDLGESGESPGNKIRRKLVVYLRNEFIFSGVHGAMNRSGSRAK